MTAPGYARPMGEPVSPETHVRLLHLITRYSIARDDKDMDTLLASFTPTATFERRGAVVEGLDAIRAFFAASMSRYDWTTHTNDGALFHSIDGDRAGGVVTGHAELVLGGTLHVASYRYRDEYECGEGGWLISRRSLAFLYAMPAGELSTPMAGVMRIRWKGQQPQAADYPESLETWCSEGSA